MLRRHAVLGMLSCLSIPPASACMCFTSADEQFAAATMIFLARIESVVVEGDDANASVEVAAYALIQSYKGSPVRTGSVRSARWWLGTSCRSLFLALQAGEYWVFYTDESTQVDRCRGGRQIDPGNAGDQRYLASLKARRR